MAEAPNLLMAWCLDPPFARLANAQVSKFAAIPEVRQKLFAYQRSLADLARDQNMPAW